MCSKQICLLTDRVSPTTDRVSPTTDQVSLTNNQIRKKAVPIHLSLA